MWQTESLLKWRFPAAQETALVYHSKDYRKLNVDMRRNKHKKTKHALTDYALLSLQPCATSAI
jgi:hypothetical protein